MTKYLVSLAAAALLVAAAPPPAGGSISIEPAAGQADGDAATRAFAAAAGEALAARGFTILEDPGHSAWVAELRLTRADVGTGEARVPPGRGSAAPGGAFGSVGAGVSLPVGANTALVPLRRTELRLLIRKRGEAAPVWSGDAVTIRPAGTRGGTDEAVAAVLTEALLHDYPVEPAGVLGVP